MSRLNAAIKLLFCWGELFFVLVSLLFVVASVFVSTGQVAALAFPAAVDKARTLLLLSLGVFSCTCWGCLGAVRQTFRKGCCTGRRILCMHQALLVVVLIFSVSHYEWLNKREQSFSLVANDPESFPELDGFEVRISKYFDNAYFSSLCSDETSSVWLLDFVDERCPEKMGREDCSLPERKKKYCDTTCAAIQAPFDATTQDLLNCCPSQELCEKDISESCPYHRCRVEIVEELLHWAGNAKMLAQFTFLLSSIMLVLTCLLICFNPRDEIEIELLKTGVMTHEDIEAVRRLKESANLVTKRGSTISVDSLDTLKRQQQQDSLLRRSKFGRKKSNRVSPTNV